MKKYFLVLLTSLIVSFYGCISKCDDPINGRYTGTAIAVSNSVTGSMGGYYAAAKTLDGCNCVFTVCSREEISQGDTLWVDHNFVAGKFLQK